MTNWREATCEKCKYQVNGECRRFPPNENRAYPAVKYFGGISTRAYGGGVSFCFTKACAEYAEEGQIYVQNFGQTCAQPCNLCRGTKELSNGIVNFTCPACK